MIKNTGQKFIGAGSTSFSPVLVLYGRLAKNGVLCGFDAKRRLVYFWSWGQLYIMHYPKSVQRDREQLLSFLSPEFFHPVDPPETFRQFGV